MGYLRHKTRGSQRYSITRENEEREQARRARLEANPRSVVENILSRTMVRDEVARRMINRPDEGHTAAVEFVAERWHIPAEIVRECIAVEALETGQ